MRNYYGLGLLLCAVCATLTSCAKTPVTPSSWFTTRVNSEAAITEYTDRARAEYETRMAQNSVMRQLGDIRRQMQELQSYVLGVQVNQQGSEKGKGKGVRRITVPSFLSSHGSTAHSIPSAVAPIIDASEITPTHATVREPVAMSQVPLPETATMNSHPPLFVRLNQREYLESGNHSIVFRLSEPTGISEFAPSDTLTSYLKQAMSSSQRIEVRGYTDGAKNLPFEARIASDRAENGKRYLVAHGIPETNIEVKSFPIGENIADNTTAIGRAKNRRVELEFMGVEAGKIFTKDVSN